VSDAFPWPEPSGPHPVGVVTFEVTDTARAAQLAPTPTPFRRLPVTAWYPAAHTPVPARKTYFSDAEAAAKGSPLFAHLGLGDEVYTRLAQLRTASRVGADLPAGDERYPLLVFNHGGLSYAQQNQRLMEHLASHGYVVVSIGHPFEAGAVVFADGAVAQPAPSLGPDMGDYVQAHMRLGGFEARMRGDWARQVEIEGELMMGVRRTWLGRLAHVWRDDSLFVVDCLQDGKVAPAAARLTDRIDFQRLGYMGMSFGGAVAGLACQADARAGAGWNIDGGNFSSDLFGTELRCPFLMSYHDMPAGAEAMGITEVPPLSPTIGQFNDLFYGPLNGPERSTVHRVAFPGVTHMDYTDIPILAPDAPGLGPVPAERKIEVVNAMGLAFFDAVFKGGAAFKPSLAEACPELVWQDRAAVARAQGFG
jgi:hypothetical protein